MPKLQEIRAKRRLRRTFQIKKNLIERPSIFDTIRLNLLDFRGPGGVWRDTFSNCFFEFFVINASSAFILDFIDFGWISGTSGDPFGSIFEKTGGCFSRCFSFEFYVVFWIGSANEADPL